MVWSVLQSITYNLIMMIINISEFEHTSYSRPIQVTPTLNKKTILRARHYGTIIEFEAFTLS